MDFYITNLPPVFIAPKHLQLYIQMATTITPKSRPRTPAPAPAAAQGKGNLSTPTRVGTSTEAHSGALLNLTCEDATETQRYPIFVRIFNAILEKLKGLKGLPLRGPTDLDILFHTNDPAELASEQKGLTNKRKPDIAVVTYEAANRSVVRDIQNRKNIMEHAMVRPRQSFKWADLLCTFEFKLSKDNLEVPKLPLTKSNGYGYDTKIRRPIKSVDNVVTLSLKAAATGMSVSEGMDHLRTAMSVVKDVDNFIAKGKGAGSSQKDRVLKRSVPLDPGVQDADHQVPKRAKVSSKATEKPEFESKPPIIQNASYAVEMLCRGVYATHAITVLIDDDVAWLWWFDRQGAIQSTGINFIQDLPYFVVLLVAFQRFNLNDWGIIKELHPNSSFVNADKIKCQKIVFKSGTRDDENETRDNLEFVVPAGSDDGHWCLVGRGTRVMFTTEPESQDRLILKFSWPEVKRTSEAAIVEAACELDNEFSRDHLPRLVASHVYGYTTEKIREKLHIKPRENSLHREARELRVMVSHSLTPLSKWIIPVNVFMRFWVEFYQCHRILWINGIEHRDISISNLMFREAKGVVAKGVLNDFDLAVYRTLYAQPGGERTGTVPYMALDLLNDAYFSGQVQRRYRHDLESFIWVLVANTLECAENPVKPFDISSWVSHSDYRIVRSEKFELQSEWPTFPETLAGTDEYQWKLAKALLKWLENCQRRRRPVLSDDSDDDDSYVKDLEKFEDSDDVVLEGFEKIVERHWPDASKNTGWPIFKPMGSNAGKAGKALTAV
ncbi:hypothetical protein H0H81_002287 [Sphagnurus paluster]|uniref:Fungal-type protein kinase domain-containing protein n=1 Tax=Sphagnurus paluster TaxID=117069 RepID=A0A9P7K2K8_9AGAR|nr:hypothetical protein H0H81_002287 [Sphagnurus paluster]